MISSPAISIQNVFKVFRDGIGKQKTALHDVCLEIKPMEVFGFLGPNGAGKSTTIKLLLDFIRPDAGRLEIAGQSPRDLSVRKQIGYLPEQPCFSEYLTGREFLLFGGLSCGLKKDHLKNRIDALLSSLDLQDAGDRLIRGYSKGMMQRMGSALCLVHDPDILILDEPMSGLDPLGRKIVTELILEMQQEGKTIFFSSHILSDIERLCDGIAIINKGRLLFSGKLSSLKREATDSLEDVFIQLIQKDNETSFT